VSPEFASANERIATALRATGSAYERLAASARREHAGGYRAARRKVTRTEAELRRALRALEQATA
jgi:hypothetical protein